MDHKIKILFVLLITHFNILNGQLVTTFHKLSVKEGLTSDSGVYQFHKSNNGMFWLGSFNGLNRFDGKTVKQYFPNLQDSTSLSEAEIQGRILAVNGSDFWVGTSSAIHYYNNKQDNFDKISLKWNNKELKDYKLLLYDKVSEKIWINTQSQLFYVSIKENYKTTLVDSLKQFHGGRESLVINKNELLFLIPYQNNIEIRCYLNGEKKWSKSYFFDVEMENKHYTFFYENENNIWVGANKEIFRINLKSDKKEVVIKGKYKNIKDIVGIQPLNKNELIVATKDKGIYILNKDDKIISNQVHHFRDDYLKPFSEDIDQIYVDNDKILWIYSPSNGIYHSSFNKAKFKHSLYKDKISLVNNNSILGVSVDSQNRLWCLTRDGIIVLNSRGEEIPEFQKYSGQDIPFRGSKPYHIFCDNEDRIWITTSYGLFLLNYSTNKIIKISTLNPLSKRPIFTSTNQFRDEKIIVNTFFSGTFQIKTDSKIPYLIPFTDFKEKKELGISYSGEKRVLLHQMNAHLAVYKRNGDKLTRDTFFKLNSFVSGITSSSKEDKYWLATTEGLYEIKEIKNHSLTINKDTLFNYRNLKGILIDSLGNQWISATNELIKYNPTTHNTKVYKTSDGLQSEEFNDWSFCELKNGNFAFGGGNGLNIFNPYEINDYPVPANPSITSILINDQIASNITCHNTGATNIIEINNLNLPYQDNTLSFRFAPLEYSAPLSCQYKYRITPTETNWVHSGTENFARYANLSPGDYTFEVDATNSDGIWSNNPAKLDITILPPWYQTWWFRTLAALGIAGVIYLIYRNRVQQIQKEADFKRKEAEYKQLAAETETAVLRLQMNPHFIFNSMNSISSYLLQKDIETANDYLGRFARLMRKILMVAEEPYLSLYDEIELLGQYMQAEAMRFEEKFQYQFIVGETIDTDDVLVPTMILQPFVENAIWHGISNKKGIGKIEISFTINQDKLICSITDNGIGRKAASKNTTHEHESKAISITQRRLNLLATEHSLSFQPSLAIHDLVNPQNQATGTTIILTLPLI